jgi:hypothetical protein
MSRYLKDSSAASFRFKKFFTEAGTYSIQTPAGARAVKTIVFGGGGNSCTTTITNCRAQTQQCCCCCWVRGHFSGAGGGYTEKLWLGVGGQKACVVVGGAEGTSSVCFCGYGSISATGGTGSGTSTRTMTGGCGTGGDINSCGSPGFCRCTWGNCRFDCLYYCCNYNGMPSSACWCIAMCSRCYCELMGVHLPGGTPGNALCNRVNLSDDTTNTPRCCCGGFGGYRFQAGGDSPYCQFYYTTRDSCDFDTAFSSAYTTVPGYCWGFPSWYCTAVWQGGTFSCIDPGYDFIWDPIGNCCCTCSRPAVTASTFCSISGGFGNCTYCSGNDNGQCYCNVQCYCFVNRNNESVTSTALGAPGYGCAPGAMGGGGAGIWNGDATRCLTDYSRSGGIGIVVIHY